MSTQVQRRRGTTAEHAAFTGAVAELTVDTTKKTVVVHDGVTAGGVPLAREDALPDTSLFVAVDGSSVMTGPLVFEGSTADTFETSLTVTDPTADRIITLPDATGTVTLLESDQTFTGAQRGAVTTDNDGSFDMAVGNNFLCTPGAAQALTFTNITAGQSGNILLVNASTYAITAHANTKVGSTTLATLSVTGTYWLSYYSPDGVNVYVVSSGAMA